ncbi:MAG: cupin domain-containing protein [Actinobacteria bacterium]|nr:cupin domain-containing protein [Actinomycetota bacterium]
MRPVPISEDPRHPVAIRLALDEVVITETRFAGGERGPDAHVHHAHADCFYVLEGSLVLELPDGDRPLPAGSWALVPPKVVHSFRTGADGARFLNLHAPSVGFDRYLLASRGKGGPLDHDLLAGFDQQPPPADGGLDPALVTIRSFREGPRLEKEGESGIVLATAEETRGALGVVERVVEPGAPGPPLHVHDRTGDAFLVLDGRFAVQLGEERRELAPGDVLLAAPGVVHGRTEAVNGPARLLNLFAPGGLEAAYGGRAALADVDFRPV